MTMNTSMKLLLFQSSTIINLHIKFSFMVKTNNVIVQIIYLLTILFFFNSKFIYCQHNQSKSNKLSKVYSSLDSSILNYEKTCRLHDSLFLINKSIKQKKEKYDEKKNILKFCLAQRFLTFTQIDYDRQF